MFKTDTREFADFHPSETLDQNQFLEVILLNKVKIFNGKSKHFVKQSFMLEGHNYNDFSILAQSKHSIFSEIIFKTPIFTKIKVAWTELKSKI